MLWILTVAKQMCHCYLQVQISVISCMQTNIRVNIPLFLTRQTFNICLFTRERVYAKEFDISDKIHFSKSAFNEQNAAQHFLLPSFNDSIQLF